MSIVLLAGSPTLNSRSSRLLNVVGEKLKSLGHSVDTLRVRDLPAEALLYADVAHPSLQAALEQIKRAEAVVVGTPVYKAAYSGILKTFLDILPQDGLAGKLVLPIATGGSQNHMLALDYALRPVLSSLSAKHVLPSIYATDAQVTASATDGGIVLEEDLARRIREGVQRLSETLFIVYREQHLNSHTVFNPVPFTQIRCSV